VISQPNHFLSIGAPVVVLQQGMCGGTGHIEPCKKCMRLWGVSGNGGTKNGDRPGCSGFEEAALVNFAMPANACPSGDSGMENISVTKGWL